MEIPQSSRMSRTQGALGLPPPAPDPGVSDVFRLAPYVRLARPHHWFKNLLILPGALLFLYNDPGAWGPARLGWLAAGLACACLVSASNYVLNEILDSPGDALHPEKAFRSVPSGQVRVPLAYVEWIALAAAGLVPGFVLAPRLGCALAALWIAGALYNVPPARLKDRPYLDVLSESVNNPVRLAIGWYAVGPEGAPAWWVLLAYWMLGAFMMAVKRLAEYRWIGDPVRAACYRVSFGYYNERRLMASVVGYAVLFLGLAAVFATYRRPELFAALPLVLAAMIYYVRLGLRDESPVRDPDHLYRETGLLLLWATAFLATALLLFVDLPGLAALLGAVR